MVQPKICFAPENFTNTQAKQRERKKNTYVDYNTRIKSFIQVATQIHTKHKYAYVQPKPSAHQYIIKKAMYFRLCEKKYT